MSVSERLKMYIDITKKSVTQLAKDMDMPQTTLNNIVVGRTKPSYKVLIPLAEAGLDVHWLLTGQGSMMRSQDYKNISGDGNLVNIGQHSNSTNTVNNSKNPIKDQEIQYLKEQVELLKSQLEDKERLIKLYEAQNK